MPDGRAPVEYLQYDDLTAANALLFDGAPAYTLQPQLLEIDVRSGVAMLHLKQHGFYLLVAARATNQFARKQDEVLDSQAPALISYLDSLRGVEI